MSSIQSIIDKNEINLSSNIIKLIVKYHKEIPKILFEILFLKNDSLRIKYLLQTNKIKKEFVLEILPNKVFDEIKKLTEITHYKICNDEDSFINICSNCNEQKKLTSDIVCAKCNKDSKLRLDKCEICNILIRTDSRWNQYNLCKRHKSSINKCCVSKCKYLPDRPDLRYCYYHFVHLNKKINKFVFNCTTQNCEELVLAKPNVYNHKCIKCLKA